MNNHFVELWHKLERDGQQGTVKIAYAEESPYRIYATMFCPGNICGIAISFSSAIIQNILRPRHEEPDNGAFLLRYSCQNRLRFNPRQ